MTEKLEGPATRTRSRAISEIDATLDAPSAPKQKSNPGTKSKAFFTSNKQSLMSAFLLKPDKGYSSDSEVFVSSRKGSRSKSGKIYKSTFEFPATSTNTMDQGQDIVSEAGGVNATVTVMTCNQVQTMTSTNTNTITHTAAPITSGTHTVQSHQTVTTTSQLWSLQSTPNANSPSDTTNIFQHATSKEPHNIYNVEREETSATGPHKSTDFNTHYSSVPSAQPGQRNMDPMMTMLQMMNNKLTNIQDEIRNLNATKAEFGEQIATLQYDREDDHQELVLQRRQLNECMDKVDVLTNINVRNVEKIRHLTDRCNNLEAKAMRNELIIFGLKDTKEPCTEIVKKFFQQEMEMQNAPQIVHAYWKGKSAFKPMVVKLQDGAAVGTIYKNVSKLKGKTNHADRAYRIEDHLPEELAEIKHRNRQVLIANNKLQDAEKLTMAIKKGQLYIGNEVYQKKVTVPSVSELVDCDEAHLRRICEKKVAQSKDTKEGGSSFRVYATTTANLAEVRDFNLHIRRKHIEATHIVLSYRLGGLNKAYDEDYLDDAEHAMGRRILDQMIQQDVTNTTVIMVRHYGGKHIGGKRFEIVKKLTEEALNLLLQNLTTTSILPLRCLIQQKPRKKRQFASIRGGHKNHPRFDSAAYNRFTLANDDTYSNGTELDSSEIPDTIGQVNTSGSKANPRSTAQRSWGDLTMDHTDYFSPTEEMDNTSVNAPVYK